MKKEDTTFACVAIIDYTSALSAFIEKKAAYNGAKGQVENILALRSQNKEELESAGDAHIALTKMLERAEAAEKRFLRELKEAALVLLATSERLEAATNIRPDIRSGADLVSQARYVIRSKA